MFKVDSQIKVVVELEIALLGQKVLLVKVVPVEVDYSPSTQHFKVLSSSKPQGLCRIHAAQFGAEAAVVACLH